MRGFSLVELSIVLVILGLLTGGILAGQSLIRSAELRGVIEQTNRYLIVVHTFRDKYRAIPGDMSNATAFWGTADANTATCRTTNALTAPDPKATCNGNGNGVIGDSSTYAFERFRFWQHLANAGLIEGSYSGIQDTSTLDATPGFNVPGGRIPNSGFSAFNQYDSSGCFILNCQKLVGSHLFFFGGERVGNTSAPILAPNEAWGIDIKTDDAIPATGRILNYTATYSTTPGCTTTDSADTALYALSSTDRLCSVVIVPGF